VSSHDGHLGRVVAAAGGDAVFDALGESLGGADLTTLLLEVMRRRAAAVTPAEILQQYERDRFVRPGAMDFGRLRAVEDATLGALPPGVETVVLAPVVPLAAHSGVAIVDQHRVVSTVRRTEVAADPTNALALEAAVRRRRMLAATPRSTEVVRLASVQRVVRAQQFEGAESYPHFSIMGFVTAGRDTGNGSFERAALEQQCRFVAAALMAAGAESVRMKLTLRGHTRLHDVVEEVLGALASVDGLVAVAVPDPDPRVAYYTGAALSAQAVFAGEAVECADGGFVDWTQRLLANRKERLLVVGIGLDRLATRMPPG
jgi:hypothetical protein